MIETLCDYLQVSACIYAFILEPRIRIALGFLSLLAGICHPSFKSLHSLITFFSLTTLFAQSCFQGGVPGSVCESRYDATCDSIKTWMGIKSDLKVNEGRLLASCEEMREEGSQLFGFSKVFINIKTNLFAPAYFGEQIQTWNYLISNQQKTYKIIKIKTFIPTLILFYFTLCFEIIVNLVEIFTQNNLSCYFWFLKSTKERKKCLGK